MLLKKSSFMALIRSRVSRSRRACSTSSRACRCRRTSRTNCQTTNPQHRQIERDHPSAEQHGRPDPEGDPLFGQHPAVVRDQPHRQAVTAGGQPRVGDLALRPQFVPVVVEALQPVTARIGRRAVDVVVDHGDLEGQEGLLVGQRDFLRVVDGEFQHAAPDLHGLVGRVSARR